MIETVDPAQAQAQLRAIWGFSEFRGLQGEIVGHVLAGGQALVVMPTGSGKSLCYQLPATLLDGLTIVISPLIALMQDQVRALSQLGVPAAALNSSLSLDEQRQVERRVASGELKLLYVAPERATSPGFLRRLAEWQVSLFAIDEAHCVSQWGHDFRPEYMQLPELWQVHPQAGRLALTATADKVTRREIAVRLGLDGARMFLGGFDRPNLRYTIALRDGGKEQILRFLRNQPAGSSGVVYCLSRRKVEATAEWLSQSGFRALPYHAGLDQEVRSRHQAAFQCNETSIIVATIAFGMGVDKPDVRFVLHLDLPKSVEAYYQETGRAGRDGQPAEVCLFYGLQDLVTLQQMTEASSAPPEIKRVERAKLNALLGLCETMRCRRQVLLEYFDDSCEPCGNCDTCLSPVTGWDATEPARKALSAVFRTGQRFGVAYLTGVLRGQSDERMRGLGHDQIPTFGTGQDLGEKEWQSVFRQLIAHGYLWAPPDANGGLAFTARSVGLLKGQEQLQLRRDPVRASTSRARSGSGERRAVSSDERTPLFDALRVERTRLAREQGVPPYMIFHDSTLVDMARQRPSTLSDLRSVSGVGQTKLDRYGEAFLQVLNSFEEPAAQGA